jgi:hypothetical protein
MIWAKVADQATALDQVAIHEAYQCHRPAETHRAELQEIEHEREQFLASHLSRSSFQDRRSPGCGVRALL